MVNLIVQHSRVNKQIYNKILITWTIDKGK
jgi:hypothetical protein